MCLSVSSWRNVTNIFLSLLLLPVVEFELDAIVMNQRKERNVQQQQQIQKSQKRKIRPMRYDKSDKTNSQLISHFIHFRRFIFIYLIKENNKADESPKWYSVFVFYTIYYF